MKRLFFTLAAFIVSVSSSLLAEELANVEYLCADWGPAMKLSGKTNEPPQFSGTEEEIYFLKQVTSIKRTKLRIPDPIAGSTTKDEMAGRGVYLCKMKPDGSGKTEIRELWHNPAYPIDTQAQSTWMDVNEKTRTIALSITFAGTDLIGLWTMNLDGSDLKHVIPAARIEGHLQAIDSPSWTPDGKWIVFGESLRGAERGRIAKCDQNGGNRTYLTEGPGDCQPRVSPDGKQIAFIRWISKGKARDSWLWLVNLDSSNSQPLPNPQAKPNWSAQAHWGTYPAWSPEGGRILLSGRIIDVATGKVDLERRPVLQGQQGTYGWPQWGRLGIVGSVVNGILFTDLELREAKWIGSSKFIECSDSHQSCQW